MLPIRIQKQLIKLGLDVQVNPLAIQAGLSDALVYRVGDYALKCHAVTRVHELAAIHSAQQCWSKQCVGLGHSSWVPRLISWPASSGGPCETLLVEQNSCWEIMEWKQGASLNSIEQVTREHLQAVGIALGELHSCSRSWSAGSFRREATDHRMHQRYERLQQVLQSGFQSQYRSLVELGKQISDMSNGFEWLHQLSQGLQSAQWIAQRSAIAMEKLYRRAIAVHWIHGDSWRGNWLFDGTSVGGLIDFGQAGVRWLGFDFARAIGSMVWGESVGWEFAWSSYCDVLGEPGYDLEDVILMHRVSMVLTLVGYIDRMDTNLIRDVRSMERVGEVCRQLVEMTA